MSLQEPTLVAKVTKQKSGGTERFQCSDVYQLWDTGQVTVDRCVEDEEWGGVDVSRKIAERKGLPRDFFKAGVNRVIDKAGAMREEPL